MILLINVMILSLFQKKFVNTAKGCAELLKLSSCAYKNCCNSHKHWGMWTKICK